MDGVIVKEEPLDLDDLGEEGLYSDAEEQGNFAKEFKGWLREPWMNIWQSSCNLWSAISP